MDNGVERSRAPQADTETGWNLENTYEGLPTLFFSLVAPTPVKQPQLVIWNEGLARDLGFSGDGAPPPEAAEIFGGNRLPPGARPLAQAYAGHQYGHFTTLGDGRAILLGEQITPQGRRFDLQLKGSGPTPYSRRGDGRAALGPMLREYLVSEAMHAFGLPTTRSLAVVATGESIWRQGAKPGAVLTRVAASHLRVGTFQWAAAAGGPAAVRALLDYAVDRHYPELANAPEKALAFLQAVIARQASLIARWMLVGFVHGVMNTDNMAISGETIDYGPCAFMDRYDPATVFSSIDEYGRYAYGNQPRIAQWNLARLAETLIPWIHPDEKTAIAQATAAVHDFNRLYEEAWWTGLRRKLGFRRQDPGDRAMADDLLGWMKEQRADFTQTFAALAACDGLPPESSDAGFRSWRERHRQRVLSEENQPEVQRLMAMANPVYIPRNHRVEAALDAAEQGDLRPFRALLDVLTSPFERSNVRPEYALADPSGAEGYRTFCGT